MGRGAADKGLEAGGFVALMPLSWEADRCGIMTIGLVPIDGNLDGRLSFLIGDSGFLTGSGGFGLSGFSKTWISSGAQNLQLQLSGSALSSEASHSK